MDLTVFFLVFVLLYAQNVDSATGLSLRLLNEKIDFLEAKLTVENKQRHNDYENIMSKLNEITKQLEHREHQPSIADSSVGTSEENSAFGGGTKGDSTLNDQLQYLIKGMIDEKRVNRKTRQKLPNIERTLDEIDRRMKREILRLDSEFTTASLACKEHTGDMSIRIEDLAKTQNDQLSRMETEFQGTNDFIETLSNNFNKFRKQHDEQFENITSGIDVLMTTHDDKFDIIQNQLADTINKQCNIDSIRPLTVTTTESPSNTPDSTEKSHVPSTIIASCQDAYKNGIRRSGVYTMNNNGKKHEIYCDQESDGGGWTVFQRRQNGDVDFFRDWESYKVGFGDLTGEFWLGNDYMSSILGSGEHELRIDLEDFVGNRAYAKYSSFLIDPESNHYTLHVDGFSGDAGDALAYHNGQKFSTKDADLDQSSSSSCSNKYKGAWWYDNCHHSNLNGLYHSTSEDRNYDGLNWGQYKWKEGASLKFVEMKFRSI